MSHYGSKGHGRVNRKRPKLYSLAQIETAFKEGSWIEQVTASVVVRTTGGTEARRKRLNLTFG